MQTTGLKAGTDQGIKPRTCLSLWPEKLRGTGRGAKALDFLFFK